MTAVGMLMRRHRLAREAAEASAKTASFPDGKPTNDWNKAEIVAYLATVGVKAAESKKKDELLALVPTTPEVPEVPERPEVPANSEVPPVE